MSPMRNPGTAVSGPRLHLIIAALALAICGALAITTIAAPPAGAAHHKSSKQSKKAKKKAKKKKAAKKKQKKAKKKRKQTVKVMTRNLYLGTDLTPAIESTDFLDFIQKNGQLLRNVDANNFAVRAKGLAGEILSKSPDLVGLQEVALWRTGPPDLQAPLTGVFTASDVHADFLQMLLDELNRKGKKYRVAKAQNEFDFEAPADYDDNFLTGGGGGEINGRLTLSDVIIARAGAGVKIRSTDSGNFETIYQPVVSGVEVNVDRAWVSADVKVRKVPSFRFVNTHLEAYGDDKNKVVDCMSDPAPEFAANPVSIRCSQAMELVAPGGPLGNSKKRAILAGDLNSDDDSVIDEKCPSPENVSGSLVGNNGGQCGDTFAYNALMAAGLRNRSTDEPLSCCVNSDIMTDNFGSRSDFDHQVDHILTNQPKKVRLLSSSVTGLKPVDGYWSSDHAGVFSKLRVKP